MNLSLTRRRGGDDPAAVAIDELARSTALAAVDDALLRCAGRRRFTPAEAAAIVADVRTRVDERALGDGVHSVLEATESALAADTMIDGARLTDALLDLRLALRD